MSSQSSRLQANQHEILRLTNAIRDSHRLPRVTLSATLSAIAGNHNQDMGYHQKRLSHTSSNGASLSDRLRSAGYRFGYASENVAMGQRTCQDVMNSWMASQGHKENILNARGREMGVHVGVWNGSVWWTVVFGARL